MSGELLGTGSLGCMKSSNFDMRYKMGITNKSTVTIKKVLNMQLRTESVSENGFSHPSTDGN